ncbi:type IV pilin protein [Reichenbachiella ulvae]|uniref:Prepilin-type N-terminal cleavage/methylation domain-containing protein n=1 Tax=Reichenbachiella ulvae TaxID=2980104 RepID=A0ABT3CV25_9BACT|nr:prepilin-type N-terminal cleavage/methylation domain-containing protein [Reichenbachiella ulvae]MCV9387457.1 prepilin-type N-terminal cleavage/methylation domain-containing protein [Reichenbachiella ulvae]
MKVSRDPKLSAFTLSELLVVLVIIGVLILMALPSLMPLISKTRSLEAKQALKHVHTLQKTYFYEYARFGEDLNAIGFESERLSTDPDNPGNANYLIEIVESTPNTYMARATAVVDFDGDGQMNVWEVDQMGDIREVTRD